MSAHQEKKPAAPKPAKANPWVVAFGCLLATIAAIRDDAARKAAAIAELRKAPGPRRPVERLYPDLYEESVWNWDDDGEWHEPPPPVLRPSRKGAAPRPERQRRPAPELPADIMAAAPAAPIGAGCQLPRGGGVYHSWRNPRTALDGRVVRPHGGHHDAVDSCAPIGTPVNAFLGGYVRTILTNPWGSAGIAVEVCHNQDCSTRSRYLHLIRTVGIAEGTIVRAGQHIADSGDTGTEHMRRRLKGEPTEGTSCPHLHFEAYREGRAIDPTALFEGCR